MTSQSPIPLTNCAYHSRRKLLVLAGAGRSRPPLPPASTAPRARHAGAQLVGVRSIGARSRAHLDARRANRRAAQVDRDRQRGDVARRGRDVHGERRRVAAEPRRADAGRVDRGEQLGLERGEARVARRRADRRAAAPSWPARRPCRRSRRRRRRPAAAGTRRSPSASTVSSTTRLHALDARRSAAASRRGSRCRVPPPLSITWTVAPVPGRAPSATSTNAGVLSPVLVRSNSASRTTLMRRFASRYASATAASMAACRSPQTHSSAPSSTRTQTVPVSWHSGTRRARRCRRCRAAARARRGRAASARAAAAACSAASASGRSDVGDARDGGADRVGDLCRGEHATPAGRASRPPRRSSRRRPAARRAPRR